MFRETCFAEGLYLNETPIADGVIHRFKNEGKGKSGWYVLFPEGNFGIAGDWASGYKIEWRREGYISTSEDRQKIKKAMQEATEAQFKQWEAKAKETQEYIAKCKTEGFSEYLKRKKIYPHGALFDGNKIIIPLQDSSGKIWSYQTIFGNGDKLFLGEGKKQGCYFPIFGRNVSKDELVVVCEGFATGASIHQSTGLPVVVALDAYNLKPVCDSLPFSNIIIAADNDRHKKNTGEIEAKNTGYPYVMPEVDGWDFSDVFLNDGDIISYFKEGGKEHAVEFQAHGLVGEIADWITSTAIRPQPKLSLAAALTFVGMLKGHMYSTSSDLRTNILTMCLAPTASGKEHPQNCLFKLIKAAGLKDYSLGKPASGTGLLTGLQKSKRVGLLVIDELGRYLGHSMSKGAGSWQKEIIDIIIESFSKANSVMIGKQYGNEKTNPRIDLVQPHLCVFGASVKERLVETCTSTEAIDGFLNRWIIFENKERPDENPNGRPTPPPPDLVARIIESRVGFMPVVDKDDEPLVKAIGYTPEARVIMDEYAARIARLLKDAKAPLDALYSRSKEHVAKLAIILCDNEFVRERDIKLAIQIVEESGKLILSFVNDIADNQHEADFLRVQRIIKDAKIISRNELTRKTQFLAGGNKKRDEIIQSLIDSNIAVEMKEGKKISLKYIAR